jgi:hypothetical protein
MDFDQIDYQRTLSQQRKILWEKFQNNCVLAFGGGLFLITSDFLASIRIIEQPAEWILDMNQNPIWIPQVDYFYKKAHTTYYTALADYGNSYTQLKSQRSVKSLVDL